VQLYSFVIPALIATWGITRGQAGCWDAALIVSAFGDGWRGGSLTASGAFAHCKSRSCGSRALRSFPDSRRILGSCLRHVRSWDSALEGVGCRSGSSRRSDSPQHRARPWGHARGWAVGWGIAALLYAFFFSILPAQTAWRAMFMVGVAPAFLVFWVRRYVEEPSLYLESRAKLARAATNHRSLKYSVSRCCDHGSRQPDGNRRAGGYFAVTTWLPTFLRTERNLSVLDSAAISPYRLWALFAAICRVVTLRTALEGDSLFLFLRWERV